MKKHITKITILTACLTISLFSQSAFATQIQAIARLKGAEKNELIGMGLVVGLNGTGDGGKFLPAMRPLANVITQFVDAQAVASELNNSKNVALVTLSATVPESGVRDGDTIDVHVSSIGPAKSLSGGRLFMVPLTGPRKDSPVFAFASGALTVENSNTPTVAVIRRGARVVRDVMTQFLDPFGRITLVIEDANATWPMANNIANHVNELMNPEGNPIARAVDRKNIIIQVPVEDRENPAIFISRILQSYLDPSLIALEPRVVINQGSGTIIISGDVTISPVLISHRGLTIDTLSNAPGIVPDPTEEGVLKQQRFLGFDPNKRSDSKLTDLLIAFNQLKVESEDRIAIIRELHRSGKLHAKLMIQ